MDGSHVKDDHDLNDRPLAVHHVAHLLRHDSETAMPVTLLLHMPSTCLLATEAVVLGNGSHVKHARLPSEHAAVELLAVHPAAHSKVPDSESAKLTLSPM